MCSNYFMIRCHFSSVIHVQTFTGDKQIKKTEIVAVEY